jgi:hypothetical protein
MAARVGQFGTVRERMLRRVKTDHQTGCWNWTGALANGKYGHLFVDGRMQKAHRIAYRMVVGPIPHGMDLDHLCRNTKCVNPNHLEPVTRSENLRRSPLMGHINANKTHCIRGHEFTAENTRVRPNGHRVCKECMRMHIRNWRKRNAAAA